MIDAVYGAIESRILAYETARRGKRHARGVERDPDAILSLQDVEGRIDDAEIVSFDIFDTLIHRSALAAEAITRKTAGFARLLAGPVAGQVIYGARHRLARTMKADLVAAGRGDEPPLDALFTEALALAGIAGADDLARRLVAFEAESERTGIIATPGVVEVVANIRAQNRIVIATSDMYLPKQAIDALLDKAGLAGMFDHLYVSSACGWTKKSTNLYRDIARWLDVAPERCLHIGDRLDSDVRPARLAGWRALHLFDQARVAKAEARRLADSYIPSPPLRRRQVTDGIRIASGQSLGSIDLIVEELIGPAVGLLAMTALTHAHRMQADRLLHLTRDATVIGEIAADALITHPHLGPRGLDIAELCISRAQGALLGLRVPDDIEKLAHLMPYLTDLPPSARALQLAFGLPDDAFNDALRGANGPAFMAMTEDTATRARLFEAITEKREAVEQYLKGIGLIAPGRSLLVDIGYSGTFGVQLSDLFHANPVADRQVECLFLLTSRYLNGNLRLVHPQIQLHPGMAMDHRSRSARWATWNFAWAEPFFVDPDRGKLQGYRDGIPHFDPSPLDQAVRDQRADMRRAIRSRALRFIDQFHRTAGDAEEIAACLQRRFARFAGTPTRAEERAVRSISHQSGQGALDVRIPTRRVNPLVLWSEMQNLRFKDHWVQGSLTRSGLGFVNHLMRDPEMPDRRADPRMMWE